MSAITRVNSRLLRGGAGYFHWCDGCHKLHPLPDGWTFDGNLDSPTFDPSFAQEPSSKRVCHYFLHQGNLEYLSDSFHALAGRTVPLPVIPQEIIERWVENT